MLSQSDGEQVRSLVQEFLQKMTVEFFDISVQPFDPAQGKPGAETTDVMQIEIQLNEPKFLIGQNGQTLFELQRMLRLFLNRKLQKSFYVDLDINEYKKKKIESLQFMAREYADEVVNTHQKKILPPMSSYERRIIHAELAVRKDIITESRGEAAERCVCISPVN